VGVDVRSVKRWESGDAQPSGAAESVLAALEEMLRRDPSATDDLIALLAAAVTFGGLSYWLLQLLERMARTGEKPAASGRDPGFHG